MGEILSPKPVLLLIAVSSRYDEALAWAERRGVEEFGPLLLKSEAFDFSETDYYLESMGHGAEKAILDLRDVYRSRGAAPHQTADQRLGIGVRSAEQPSRDATAESRSWLSYTRQARVGFDKGSCSSPLLGRRYFCRGDAQLSPARVAELRLDVPRLSTARFSGVFYTVPTKITQQLIQSELGNYHGGTKDTEKTAGILFFAGGQNFMHMLLKGLRALRDSVVK